ncbi:protein FAM151B isoform X3 [Entelurus aequoreus]|uniref:protein FAM151B isoform X3 n=1 Tax=Entelurus aequoreus TaxID=161455 RepID=UPI002B1E59AC|nr:protein FAM151B isoform X3 [Entelurus aequoreus]
MGHFASNIPFSFADVFNKSVKDMFPDSEIARQYSNGRTKATQIVKGPTHMIEADILMRGSDPKEPIMAHPPDTDSDITLKEWLERVRLHNKGVKLDFKSLEAVSLSASMLQKVLSQVRVPVWVNADILPGPGGYSWDMVHEMEAICRGLKHLVTFPVRAALLAKSVSQLTWLLQESNRYSLTVWTGQNDTFTVQDLLPYRTQMDVSRICYDLPDIIRTELINISQDNIC